MELPLQNQERLLARSDTRWHNGTRNRSHARGRRIQKTINGATTAFLYDGQQAIAELQGSSIGTTYLTGLQIDEVLARYAGSGNRTLLTDALGSVLALTDDSQTAQTIYGYSAYGEQTQVGANDSNSLQYTGRENDNTGLYFYRARYYDPGLKRFVNEDPIGLFGGINPYLYVRANPLRYVDPYGLREVGPPELFGGGGGGDDGDYFRAVPLRPTEAPDEFKPFADWPPIVPTRSPDDFIPPAPPAQPTSPQLPSPQPGSGPDGTWWPCIKTLY